MPHIEFIPISANGVCAANKIVAIVSYDSAPTRRQIQEARDERRLVDATGGQKTRGVIIMESNHILLSPMDVAALRAEAWKDDEEATFEK